MSPQSYWRSRDIDLSEVKAAKPAATIAYWRQKTPVGAPYPARSDIDPLDIPRLLGHLAITEVHRGPELSFRFRLFGTALADMLQADATGKWLSDDSLGAIAPYVRQQLTKVALRGTAFAAQSSLHQQGREYVRYQVVDLPLGDTDNGVTMIMSCLEQL